MALQAIYDSRKKMGMVFDMEGMPPKGYSVELMDHERGVFLFQVMYKDYYDAKKTFDELQRAYDLH